MAIYHLHVSVGTRKAKHSAEAKYNYICRCGKFSGSQKSDGKKDVRSSNDVHFVLSKNLPEWAIDSAEFYWLAADVLERKNAVLYREIEFALPKELSLAEHKKLVTKFADSVAVQPGGLLPYTLAIHCGSRHNPHCHLMLSEKTNDGVQRSCEMWFKKAASRTKDPATGGARKADIVNQKDWLQRVRKQWADLCNESLSQNGHEERIDHQSYADRGIDQLPQIHLGARLLAALKNEKVPESLEYRLHLYDNIHKKNIQKQYSEDNDQGLSRDPRI